MLTQKPTGAARIMVALDVDELSEAESLAEELKGLGVTFKIGNQLGTFEGWKACIEFAHSYGAQIFCDTKFKDIPATVEKSSRAITRHQPDFFNIMADTNVAALEASVAGVQSAIRDFDGEEPVIIGVTVLTSISEQESKQIYGDVPAQKVIQFAENCVDAGVPAIVCSAQEAKLLRQNSKTSELLLITPGIRPKWAASGDQQRIMTPAQAIEDGADYLVIGRPITQPPAEIGSARAAVEKIIEEIGD